MRSLKAPFKDWRRRRALARHGVRTTLAVPQAVLLGARSGTWATDLTGLGPDSVVYSAGVGDDLSWDLAVVERTGARVHAFDPTPRALAWLARQRLPERLRPHALGLAGADGERTFAPPARERSVNYAIADGGGAGPVLAVRRVATIARELGHDRVDLLKLDVEGAEYEVLGDLLAHGPLPRQLLVEFHHGQGPWTLDHTLRAIETLAAAGYEPFWISRRGLEFSFLRVPGADARR